MILPDSWTAMGVVDWISLFAGVATGAVVGAMIFDPITRRWYKNSNGPRV